MCGVSGVFSLRGHNILANFVQNMVNQLMHRGPDGYGVWCENNIGFGHTRLSIHDLSDAGRQPMFSHSERWIITFNGEIYNYKKLRMLLEKEYNLIFKSDSDTEVLVNAIEYWGIKKTLQECVGMFAFAVFDRKLKHLYLARDRFGEKPLFYGQQNDIFAFSSELKSLKSLENLGWEFVVNRDVLATYMRYGYVSTPYCIYKNISKLEPGSYLEISENGKSQIINYWSARDVLQQKKYMGSYNEAVDLLETKLLETLNLQMSADVPLGAFLSGGVDSATIVALMQSISSQKINSFSIGFHDAEFNEADKAKEVAHYIGTAHTELYLSEKDILKVIPRLSDIYDEPFADSSQLPTFLVCQMAKTSVTVALSGDGGDELFGGYNRYLWTQKIKSRIFDHSMIKFGVEHVPNFVLKFLKYLPFRYTHLYDKALKIKEIIKNTDGTNDGMYQQICSQIYNVDFVLDGSEHLIFDKFKIDLNFEEWMMFVDSQTYMIDDILQKVDRAAMAVSLETRVPFLDHHIYEYAWSLPKKFKIRNNVGKSVLRDVLYKYVPKELVDRPKMGFSVPLSSWLRGELREWAESLLAVDLLKKQNYFNVEKVRWYWAQHLSGKNNFQHALWNILMFQAWLEKWEK